MTAARKTVSVAKLLHMANTYLASEDSTLEGRRAMDAMISAVLLETGNYRGFSILEQPEIPVNKGPCRHNFFVSSKILDEYWNIDRSTLGANRKET
jgi:hypothetical protein